MSASTESLDEQSPLLVQNNVHFSSPQIRQGTPPPNPTAMSTPVLTPSPTPTPAVVSPPPPPISDKPTEETTIPAPETPGPGRLPKVDSSAPLPWGAPAGLAIRGANDENLLIFRCALGIVTTSGGGGKNPRALEEGEKKQRRRGKGVYGSVLRAQSHKRVQHVLLDGLLYSSHFAQVVIGAILTALGPEAGRHAVLITVLGAVNTVLAGLLALVKGQGLPERLKKDEAEFRKLRDWIEETDALLAVGVLGRNRREVGYLVELAFKKYNAAKASEENNRPDSYIQQTVEGDRRESDAASDRR
jgi:hypothetical protein